MRARRETLLWVLIALLAVSNVISHVQILNVQHHQNDALHAIMCRAEAVVHRTPPSAQFTAKQKRKAIRFYAHALSDAHLKPCE